jgi:hypothetical protein
MPLSSHTARVPAGGGTLTTWGAIASDGTAGCSGLRCVERQSAMEDDPGLAWAVVVIHDSRVEAETAMKFDRAGVSRRRDRLQAQRAVALRGVSERRIQTAPETGAAGIVPSSDQVHIPGAGRVTNPMM